MAVAPRPHPADVRSPLWLAHHHPWHLDRCIRVGHTAVCRRCAVLYPSVVAWWLLWWWASPPPSLLVLLSWILPLPMLVDWAVEHLRRPDPSPARLVAVTSVAAPGLAAMLTLHSRDLLDPRALLPAVVYGTIALGAAWWGARSPDTEDWRRHHLDEEARRSRHLRSLLDLDGPDERAGTTSAPEANDRIQSSD